MNQSAPIGEVRTYFGGGREQRVLDAGTRVAAGRGTSVCLRAAHDTRAGDPAPLAAGRLAAQKRPRCAGEPARTAPGARGTGDQRAAHAAESPRRGALRRGVTWGDRQLTGRAVSIDGSSGTAHPPNARHPLLYCVRTQEM